MSSYSQEELQNMSRVQLRRAALAVLKIDNKEASNAKSMDLIERILEAEGNGNGSSAGKAAKETKKTTSGKRSTRKTNKASSDVEVNVPGNGVGKLVDAVGKAVDETKEELSDKFVEVLDNQEHIMKQQFTIFGLLCDIYKVLDEPDVLEERLKELGEEWDTQGNEG
jgi:hypothetical protein